MNKAELIEQIANDADIQKVMAARALDATLHAITQTLKAGGNVTLMGFGMFKVVRRLPRAGRNPRTGQTIKIDARRAVKFTAGKSLTDEVN